MTVDLICHSILHLRLNFSYILSPIFLWGFLLSDGQINDKFWIGFISFHVFLYGGINAFNSFYDKDKGPIGGLKYPPPVTISILVTSIIMKTIGLALAIFINHQFVIVYVIALILSFLYSYPAIRWKANLNLSLFTVTFGQGALGFYAGWLCGSTSSDNFILLKFFLGIVSAALLTLSFYPITQNYQVDQDRERGDKTLAVTAGVRQSFRLSLICMGISAFIMCYILQKYFHWSMAIFFGGYFIIISIWFFRWRNTFYSSDIFKNYDRMMRTNYLNSSLFILFIIFCIFYY